MPLELDHRDFKRFKKHRKSEVLCETVCETGRKPQSSDTVGTSSEPKSQIALGNELCKFLLIAGLKFLEETKTDVWTHHLVASALFLDFFLHSCSTRTIQFSEKLQGS